MHKQLHIFICNTDSHHNWPRFKTYAHLELIVASLSRKASHGKMRQEAVPPYDEKPEMHGIVSLFLSSLMLQPYRCAVRGGRGDKGPCGEYNIKRY